MVLVLSLHGNREDLSPSGHITPGAGRKGAQYPAMVGQGVARVGQGGSQSMPGWVPEHARVGPALGVP